GHKPHMPRLFTPHAPVSLYVSGARASRRSGWPLCICESYRWLLGAQLGECGLKELQPVLPERFGGGDAVLVPAAEGVGFSQHRLLLGGVDSLTRLRPIGQWLVPAIRVAVVFRRPAAEQRRGALQRHPPGHKLLVQLVLGDAEAGDGVQPAQCRLVCRFIRDWDRPELAGPDHVLYGGPLAEIVHRHDGRAMVTALRLKRVGNRADAICRATTTTAADAVRAEANALDVDGVLRHVLAKLLAERQRCLPHTVGQHV